MLSSSRSSIRWTSAAADPSASTATTGPPDGVASSTNLRVTFSETFSALDQPRPIERSVSASSGPSRTTSLESLGSKSFSPSLIRRPRSQGSRTSLRMLVSSRLNTLARCLKPVEIST